MSGSLVVLTGASGCGKTTIALEVERQYPEYDVFRFDTIGVPPAEVMEAFGEGHQPGGAWQRAMTLEWFERIAPLVNRGRHVLFEGQMRLAFILEALSINHVPYVGIILLEGSDSTRDHRLIYHRQQPELANDSMRGWSCYLHNEAVEAGIEILDTSERTLAESVAHVEMYLRSSAVRAARPL